MKSHIFRKCIFITMYFLLFFGWMFYSQDDRHLAIIGNDIFTIIAYLVTIYWMIDSIRKTQGKKNYFWLFFALGTFVLCLSKIISSYQQIQFGMRMPHSDFSDMIRLVGYLFFFMGFIYQMKVLKNTLPMLRYLLNIIIVIVAANSASWYFIVNPILDGNQDITEFGFIISSIYHVLNISLLFAAISLMVIVHKNQSRISLYLIAIGCLVQVVGDFSYINHGRNGDDWINLLWPLSIFLMGISASLSKDYPIIPQEQEEQLEYKHFHLSFLSAGFLLLLTFYNQLHETNVLQKGLFFIVFILLLQQLITTFENKNIFNKLKRLASSEGYDRQNNKKSKKQENELSNLLRKIEDLAHYDSLTGLPNRALFQKCMEQELKLAEQSGAKFSLLYIDMDRFKYVNDSLGHDCGDILLQQVGNRLTDAVDESATVARIGGDEFAIIISESSIKDLESIANQILHKFEKPFVIQNHDIYTSPSIGISIYPEGGINTKELLKSADVAMYLAKDEGKNKYKFFDPYLNEIMSKKMLIESRMRKGLEEGSFSLHYQPQVDLRSEKIIGLEALLRWNEPELGMISPADFIPIAEETGLIEPIGYWVIKTACYQLKKWQDLGLRDVSVSVNVSIRQFQNPDFIRKVKSILLETKLDPQFLKMEITESVLENINKMMKVLNELKDLGIQIAIDDFGTGYSSLSYLKNLPVSTLKIDKAFIDELSANPEGPIVKTIIDMGRNMNFSVIAEGVESFEHVSFLRENKCFVGQGYLFSKPLPEKEMEHLLLLEEYEKIS